jgi:tetratricopeptide (TPR) repeat protein
VVLRKRPNDPQALYVRARCLDELGEKNRAIGAYRAVLDADPGNTDALQRLWQVYESEGQITDAIATLETLLQTGSAGDPEKLELARLYSETGFNSARGLKLVDELAKSGAGKGDELQSIKRKLQTNAAKEHSGGGGFGGGGISIIKPHR